MDDLTQAIVQQLVVPIISGLIMALGGWVLTHLPGPLRDALQASVHAKDVKLIVDAATNRAAAIASGHVTTASPVLDVMAYVRQALPDVLPKVNPTEESLKTIAAKAVAAARAEVKAFDAITVPGGVK